VRSHHHFMRISFSHSQITAGFIAVLVGVTSSIALVFQAATVAGATSAEISSWILSLGVGVGVSCIGLSLYYRIPILTAWSTPSAALLITSLSGVSLSNAIGAFIFSATLTILFGITGLFEKTIKQIPRSLAAAMLAGILFHFGTNIFTTMQHQFILVFAMFMTFLVGKKLFPRFAILVTLLIGVGISYTQGLFHLENFHWVFSSPIFIKPTFSLSTIISVGIPLFIVTMTSQNVPGVAIIQASGYKPPISTIISWTGIINFILAPFGGFTFNLAAITAAICLGKEADADPSERYKAAVFAGICYIIFGLFGATIVILFAALPNEFILALAGLALLNTISASMKMAWEDETQREAALITLLVTASGVTLFGMGAAFWGLLAGIISLLLSKSKEISLVEVKKYETN
jgi:benzoate membrane transport protein